MLQCICKKNSRKAHSQRTYLMDNPRPQHPGNTRRVAMTQAQNGIRLIGIIAGTAACAILLCACGQSASTTATNKAAIGTATQNTDMQEIVITASRQSPPKG